MRYEWDASKNRNNQQKHGVTFEVASLVFRDEHYLLGLDRVDDNGEQRWRAIGAAQIEPGIAAVLLVIHVYRENHDGEEIIRIISARKADQHDVQRYRQQEMD